MAVAVVVVHGVSDPGRGSSARAVADRLAEPGRAFTEVPIRVPLRPLEPGRTAGDPPQTGWLRTERSTQASDPKPPKAEPWLAFTDEQLRHRDPPTGVVDTVRLEGRVGEHDVHVHEVWWADLSRPAASVFRFLFDVYSVVLHLPNLGLLAVDHGRLAAEQPPATGGTAPRARGWRAWAWVHLQAVRSLVLVVPALAIAIGTLGSTSLATTWLEGRDPLLAAVVAGAGGALEAAGGVAVLGLWAAPARLPRPLWLPPVAGGAVGVGLGLLAWFGGIGPPVVLGVWWVGVSAVGAAIAVQYDRYQPKAAAVTLVVQLLATALLAALVLFEGVDAQALVRAGVEATAVAWSVSWAGWVVFLLLSLGSTICGAAVLAARSERRCDTARVLWLAIVTLMLPAGGFVVLTLTIASLAAHRTAPLLTAPSYTFGRVCLSDDPSCCFAVMNEVAGGTLGSNLLQLVTGASSGLLWLVCAALASLAAVAVLSLWPSVIEEVLPNRRPDGFPPPFNADELYVRLTRGLLTVRGFMLVAAGGLAALACFAVWVKVGQGHFADVFTDSVLLSVASSGLLVVGAWVGPVGRVFDLLLDVDAYLRVHPVGQTPRARIAERWWSILAHVADQNYDRIVLVTHSQGTAITVELLAWLAANGRTWSGPELRLVTMGSPLRQTYREFLPHLYGWVDGWLVPAKLGVHRWVNLYCTGDYIGRELFPTRVDRAEDVPLGAGAHTRYWDHYPEVARRIRALLD